MVLVAVLVAVTMVLGGVLIFAPHEGLKREVTAETKELSYHAADAAVGEAMVRLLQPTAAATRLDPATAQRVPATGTTSFGKSGQSYWYQITPQSASIQVNAHGFATDRDQKTIETELEVLLKYPAPDPPGISGMVSDYFPTSSGGAQYGFKGKGEVTGLDLYHPGAPADDLFGLAQSASEPFSGWAGWCDWGVTGKDASASQMTGTPGTYAGPAHPAAPSPAPRNNPSSTAQVPLPAPATQFYTTGDPPTGNSIATIPDTDPRVSLPTGAWKVSDLGTTEAGTTVADRGSPSNFKLRIIRPSGVPGAGEPCVLIDANFYGIIALDFAKHANSTGTIAGPFFRTVNGATMTGILFVNSSNPSGTLALQQPLFQQLGPPHAQLTGTVDVSTSTTLTGTGTLFLSQLAAEDVLSFPGVAGSFRVTAVGSNTLLTLESAPGSAATGVTATRHAQITGTVAITTGGAVTGTGTQFLRELPLNSVIRVQGSTQTFTVTARASDTSATVTPNPTAAIAAGKAVRRVSPTTGGPLKGCTIYKWNGDPGSSTLILGDVATHRAGSTWPDSTSPHSSMGPGMQYSSNYVATAMSCLSDRSKLVIASYRVVQ